LASTQENTSKNDRNLKYFHGEAAASSVENAGTLYQSPSIVATGAADKDVALLSSISNLLLSFVLIKIPAMLDRSSLKRVVLLFSVLALITWMPLVAVMLFARTVNPAWLIALWIIRLIPTLVTGPLRDEWLADKLPKNRMGRYLSVRSIITAVVYLSAFYIMGYFLDQSGGHIFQGYGVVLFVALLGSSVTVILYRQISAPNSDTDHGGRVYFGYRDFLKEIKRGHMGKFVFYVAMVNFATYLCSAFFTVYMLRDLHFSYLTYTLVVSADYLARIISLPFWGRLVDRTGSLRVMGIVSRFIPLIPVLWVFSHNFAYLIGIQLISGVIWSAFDLCNQTFIYQGAPRDLRLRFIVYHKSLSTFAIAAGAITGACLLNFVYPVFGSQILGLFVLSGVARFVIVAGIFPRLNKQVKEETTLEEESPVVQKPEIKKVMPEPLITTKEASPAYRRRVFTSEEVAAAALARGAYYHPEEWPYYQAKPLALSTEKIVPPNTGAYYNPQEWDKYIRGAHVRVKAQAVYPYDVQRLGLDKPAGLKVFNYN